MKKCSYCNSDIPNEAKFCSNCGKEIIVSEIIPTNDTQISKKKTKMPLIIGSVVLVFVVLLGVVIGSLGSKDYIFEKVAFGMSKSEVQRAVRYDLEEQSNGSLYHCEIIPDDTQMSYQYTFNNDDELKKLKYGIMEIDTQRGTSSIRQNENSILNMELQKNTERRM